jgi:DNA processing protein
LIALNMIPQLGPKRIMSIAETFSDISDFYKARHEDLFKIRGISEKLSSNIIQHRKNLDVNLEMKKAKQIGASIITVIDGNYPDILKHIYDPPPVLYVFGDVLTFEYEGIAIVGTRKATLYGKTIAEDFARELASMEINVVSGMARGIDSHAHKGAIDVGGPTTAVLGCGLDVIYPPENKGLMKKIAECGCVISSFPLGSRPLAANFPARNRIISGLSLGTLVVEAAERSGSLITADFSMEQGREVFAIPGSIRSPYSRGTNKLIKQGAVLVESVDDILEELSIDIHTLRKNKEISSQSVLEEEEKKVLDLIEFNPVQIEQMLKTSKLPPSQLNIILTRLELKGFISTLSGGYIMKV